MQDKQERGTTESLSTAEEQDLSIMVNLAKNMIDDGGVDVIKSAEQSRDPGQVIGQFLVQLGEQLAEKLSGLVDVSPRIMLIPDGWVEQISDYLQEEYGMTKDVMDRAEIYIGTSAQQMADTEDRAATPQLPVAAQQGAAAPVEQAPPTMPQQGVA